MNKTKWLNVICGSLSLLFCSNCASQYGPQQTRVQYYPDCYKPIYELRHSEHNVARATFGGAALGAGLGALIGLVSADDKKHRTTNALAGAAVGGVAGGMAGAMYAQKQKIADENKRMYSYLEELNTDIHDLKFTSSSALYALQCYDTKTNELMNNLRLRRISKFQAQQMMFEIQSGRNEAITILDKTEKNWKNKNNMYQTAFREERKNLQHTDAKQKLDSAERRSVETSQNMVRVSQERVRATARAQADSARVQQMLSEIDA